MRKKIIISTLFLILGVLFSASAVRASSCDKSFNCSDLGKPFENDKFRKVVFIGTVKSIVKEKHEVPNGGDDRTGAKTPVPALLRFRNRIEFDIAEVLVGKIDSGDLVYTGFGNLSFGFPFKEGQKYLVYAHFLKKDKKIWTGVCTRTKLLDLAEKEIEIIREVKAGNELRGRVFGGIRAFSPEAKTGKLIDLLTGVNFRFRVIAKREDDGVWFDPDSVENGNYEFKNLPPGTYEIFLTRGDFQKISRFKPKINAITGCRNIPFFLGHAAKKELGLLK